MSHSIGDSQAGRSCLSERPSCDCCGRVKRFPCEEVDIFLFYLTGIIRLETSVTVDD